MINQIQHIVAVASGKGGVGKSMVAANLALAMHRLGYQVGLLDADIYGPSQAVMFGVEPNFQAPMKDASTLGTLKVHGIALMSIALMIDNNTPMIWRGPMVSNAFRQLLNQTDWGKLDYLFIDMPPGTGDIHLSLVQKVAVSGAVIVTTPQEIATLDARKGIEMFQKVNVPILGIVENMSFYECPQCQLKETIFGEDGGLEIAQMYQTELLGKLPLQKRIRQQHDQGTPTVIAEPQSEVSAIFYDMAKKIHEKCAHVKIQSPDISFS